MPVNIAIALGAGLVSAVVFASASTGPTPVRLLLLALLALPIALAGFSYNARTAFLAALAGSAMVGLVFQPLSVLVFAMAVLPASGLVYLALLNRVSADGADEWYPVGRLVVAAALISGSMVALALVLFTGEPDAFRDAVKQAISETVKQGVFGLPNAAEITDEQITQVADLMLVLLPAVGATMVLVSLLVALWLGGRVALASGTLVRPWPDIAAFSMPAGTPLLLVVAFLAAIFLDGKLRFVALSYAGVLYASYVLLGLAILHYVSRGAFWRTPALIFLYALLFLANSAISLVLAMLGLADSLYPLRRPQAEGRVDGGRDPGPPP